jgi:aquaporin Z
VWAALLAEVLMTAMFLLVILGVTDERARPGIAPSAIGLCLLVIHLVTIPVTNTSVNPARSLGPALFAGGHAIGQLWLFLLAPTAGAILAGLAYPRVFGHGRPPTVQGRTNRRR